MAKARQRAQGRRGSARRRRSKPAKTGPVESGVRGAADDVFHSLSQALTRLSGLGGAIQKQYRTWAKDPPLNSNRQHRFVHKIDEWLNQGSRVIDDIETAENAGRSLPEFAKCTPKEKYAKGILAGLHATQTKQMLRSLLTTLASLVDRARQPLSAEEAKKLWDVFADFVVLLARSMEELRGIKRHIESARKRFADEATAAATTKTSSRITSVHTDRPVLIHGEQVGNSLDKFEKAIDKLMRAIGQVASQTTGSHADTDDTTQSLTAQYEDILLAFSNLDHEVVVFEACLKDDPECREMLSGHPKPKLAIIGSTVTEVINSLVDRMGLCRLWLKSICFRESTIFRLPADMPAKLREILDHTRGTEHRLRRKARAFAAPATGALATAPDFSACSSDDRRILAQLLEDFPAGTSGHTVPSVAVATGIDDQKVRRILNDRLGADGIRVVIRNKQDAARGKGNTSPPHVFFIALEHAASVRDFVRGA